MPIQIMGESFTLYRGGWKYDGTSQCVEQPAENESFAQTIRSFPAREYYTKCFMSCTRPQRIKMLGKDSSHSFGMTMRVISNKVRDPSLIPFSKETKDTKK